MLDLSTHPISQRWPATHPGVLQKNVPAWLQRCLARVEVQRGLNIPPRPAT